MPILTVIKAISGRYPDIALNPYKYFFEKTFFFIISIFYLMGEPTLPYLLRYSPFAVDDHVITSDRRERGDPLSRAERGDLLRSSQRRLRQPRLVDNPVNVVNGLMS